MIPTSWRVETLTEGRIFSVEFYKRNRIKFDCIAELLYSHGRGVMVKLAPKVLNLYAKEIKTKELKIHAEEVYNFS